MIVNEKLINIDLLEQGMISLTSFFVQNWDTFKREDDQNQKFYNRYLNVSASQEEWDDNMEADGVPILARKKSANSNVNNRLCFSLFAQIAEDKAAYMASHIEVKFSEKINDDVKEAYKKFERQGIRSVEQESCTYGAAWGNDYWLLHNPKSADDGNPFPKPKRLFSWTAKVAYDRETDDPIVGYAYRWTNRNKSDIATTEEKTSSTSEHGTSVYPDELWVYTETAVTKYHYNKAKDKKSAGYFPETRKMELDDGTLIEVPDTKPHGFNDVPILEFANNNQRQGNSRRAVYILDAYDQLMSDWSTEAGRLPEALLILLNAGKLTTEKDEKQGAKSKDKNVLELNSPVGQNTDAKYITKDINPDFMSQLEAKMWTLIFLTAKSYDPISLSELSSATAFQVKQIMQVANNDAQVTQKSWNKTYRRLDAMLKYYFMQFKEVKDYSIDDIYRDYLLNEPKDFLTNAKTLREAGGRLSNKTMITHGVPEVNAEEEEEALKKEIKEGILMPVDNKDGNSPNGNGGKDSTPPST